MTIKSNYNKSILCALPKSILCALPKSRRLLFLPIIIRISDMECSFHKTTLNRKAGTPGKGVLFCIYGENDTDNCVISRFVGFYMKKMQIGTKKSSQFKNSDNLPTQQTIFFRFIDAEWGFAQKTHFFEWGFALDLAFFKWGFALYFLWKGGLQYEKICICKKDIQRNS